MGLCKTKETVDPEISPVTHTNSPDKVGSEFMEPGVSAKTIYTSHIDKVTTDHLLQSAVCGLCTGTWIALGLRPETGTLRRCPSKDGPFDETLQTIGPL